MRRLVLVPHRGGSRAVRDLANALSAKVDHKVFRCAAQRVGRRVPFFLKAGTDKLTQMERFQNAAVDCPEWTRERAVATTWITDGTPVVCRTILRGSEGRGIVVAETTDQLVNAPLYTRYFKKKKEFRVHVFNGQVIDVQEKRKKNGHEGGTSMVRNLANGYVFCRADVAEPAGLRELAIKATAALDYFLGAVDIGYNEHHNRLVVFEVNAAPGLQGTTLESYANAIVGWYRGQPNAL